MKKLALLLAFIPTVASAQIETIRFIEPEEKPPLIKLFDIRLSTGQYAQTLRMLDLSAIQKIVNNPSQLPTSLPISPYWAVGGDIGAATNLTAGFTIRNQGVHNRRHTVNIGLSYTDDYATMIARYNNYNYYYANLYSPTQPWVATVDSVVQYSYWGELNTQNLLGNISYTYTIKPERKLSVGFTAGFGIGGALTSRFDYYQSSVSSFQLSGITDTTTGEEVSFGTFPFGFNNSQSEFQSLSLTAKKSFVFSPYLSVLVNYRLSKKLPVLRNISLFAEGRVGTKLVRYKDAGMLNYYNAGFNIGLCYYIHHL